jgi:hypothetical protein
VVTATDASPSALGRTWTATDYARREAARVALGLPALPGHHARLVDDVPAAPRVAEESC